MTAIASFYGSVSLKDGKFVLHRSRTELGHWAEQRIPLDLRLNAADHLILCTRCDLYVPAGHIQGTGTTRLSFRDLPQRPAPIIVE